MRILDEQNQELSQEDVDLSLGYLKDEKLFIEHRPIETHYKVTCFVFTDGTSYRPASEDDPHVRVVDAEKGQFEYIPDEGDERTVKGAAIGVVIDKEAEDIYEDIKRYIRYREDELELRKLPSRMEGAEESIVETQEGLEEANINIEDLILLMAEILGGDEEESEKEPEDEPIDPDEPINPDEPIDPDEPVDPDEPIIPDEPVDPEPEPTEDPVDPNDESESEPIEEPTEEPVEESTESDDNSAEPTEEPAEPVENSEN